MRISAFLSCPVNWCLQGCRNAIPSPGGKGDREAVDEEWRHLNHSQCGQFKWYKLFQCTFLTKCIQIRNISPFLIRPSVRTGAPSPRGKVLCGPHPYKHQFVERWATPVSTFQNHPRRGYHILYLISRILNLRSGPGPTGTCGNDGRGSVQKNVKKTCHPIDNRVWAQYNTAILYHINLVGKLRKGERGS